MRDTIDMAREAGFKEHNGLIYVTTINDDCAKELERFAELVRADEREKSLSLWMLLDDVDTADDIAKADDAIYRKLCRQAHAKRRGINQSELRV